MRTRKRVLIILAASVLLTIFTLNVFFPEKSCNVPTYKRAAENMLDRWIHVHWPALDVHKTSDAARMREALTPIVADLEAIREEAAALDVPECARDAHDAMLRSYDVELTAYAAYMQGDVAKGNRLYAEAGDISLEWTKLHQALSPAPGNWYTQSQ